MASLPYDIVKIRVEASVTAHSSVRNGVTAAASR